jgi:hypothetical protein
MGLLDKIKKDAERSGQNKGKFIFFKEGEKKRIRFLNDLEDGLEIVFHDSYEAGINVPCQEIFGRTCQYCDEAKLRTRSQYAWSVWDYEAKEVKILMYPMNNCSPLGAITAMYETYGTLLDRDFVINVTGKQQNKTFSVVPMDKNSFKNGKAKPYSKSALLKILDKAYPDEHADDEDDEEELKPTKAKSKNKKQKAEIDYSEMTAKELYNLCDDRGIEAEPKMKAKYYIDLLEEADEQASDASDDDDWKEDEEQADYEDMTAKELYNLCKERNIKVEPKKPEKYYIKLLKEADVADEDWEDDEDEEGEEW